MNPNQELLNSLLEASTKDFVARINEPVFKAADIPMTYRVINLWHQKNLFPYQKEAGQWRYFSMVDYVWVLFMKRLRLLNVGLQTMANVKAQCFSSVYPLLQQSILEFITTGEPGKVPKHFKEGIRLLSDPDTKTALESPQMRLFSLWLMIAIKHNADVLVRILPDEANTTSFVLLKEAQTDTEAVLKNIAREGGLFISLQALLNEFYRSERFAWENMSQFEIDKEAKTIVALMREKGIKQVVIKLEEGSVHHVQTERQERKMSSEEFSNAVLAKKFMEYKVLKNKDEMLLVSAKQNYKIKDGHVVK